MPSLVLPVDLRACYFCSPDRSTMGVFRSRGGVCIPQGRSVPRRQPWRHREKVWSARLFVGLGGDDIEMAAEQVAELVRSLRTSQVGGQHAATFYQLGTLAQQAPSRRAEEAAQVIVLSSPAEDEESFIAHTKKIAERVAEARGAQQIVVQLQENGIRRCEMGVVPSRDSDIRGSR